MTTATTISSGVGDQPMSSPRRKSPGQVPPDNPDNEATNINTNTTTNSPQAHLLKRVLSGGAAQNRNTDMDIPSDPLSPDSGSGGARTPKARNKGVVRSAGTSSPAPAPRGSRKHSGEVQAGLAGELDQLNVRSPATSATSGVPPPQTGTGQQQQQMEDVPMFGGTGVVYSTPAALSSEKSTNGNGTIAPGGGYFGSGVPPHPHSQSHDRSFSSSTDSSYTSGGMGHPIPPSSLGSVYGAEGFSNFGAPSTTSPDLQLTAQAAAAVAAADEAIKQLNGTSSVFQGPPQGSTSSLAGPAFANLGQGGQGDNGNGNPYSLPRGYAGFTKPREPRPPSEHAVTRQSSTSSTTTEASTSSEESDLCIPTIEWVTRSDVPPSTAAGFSWNSNPYLAGSGSSPRNGGPARNSPARMPPPSNTGSGRVTSPRRSNGNLPPPSHLQAASQSAGSSTVGQNQSQVSAGNRLHPGGGPTNEGQGGHGAVDESDDDDATVGHGRDRSPSTSSQSARSGLDLLWRAASHSNATNPTDRETSNAGGHDTKGKRKAGAEAVAQWRISGIPSGVRPSPQDRRSSAYSEASSSQLPLPTSSHPHPSTTSNKEPPKKRRRSEMKMEDVDPGIKKEQEERLGSEEAMQTDGGSEYRSSHGSIEEEPASEGDDSEYGVKPGTRRGSTRGKPPRRSGAIGGIFRGRVLSGDSSGKPGGSRKGAAGGKKTESPSGKGSGVRRGSNAPGAGSVRCSYVNPLPPYNQCQDVFTRRYDLPRHMARHARREGELVYEGKLAEEKALLWKTIKDKPKVECPICHETFTRMDALKRHQAKQHH